MFLVLLPAQALYVSRSSLRNEAAAFCSSCHLTATPCCCQTLLLPGKPGSTASAQPKNASPGKRSVVTFKQGFLFFFSPNKLPNKRANINHMSGKSLF